MNAWDTVLGNRTMESINCMAHDLGKIKENQPTLRDQFAMAAMNGLLSDTNYSFENAQELARTCYRYADAFIEVRKEK